MRERVYGHVINEYCGNNAVEVADPAYRQERYDRMQAIAAGYGLTVRRCGCKNPDLTGECCHPPMPELPPHTIPDLFTSREPS